MDPRPKNGLQKTLQQLQQILWEASKSINWRYGQASMASTKLMASSKNSTLIIVIITGGAYRLQLLSTMTKVTTIAAERNKAQRQKGEKWLKGFKVILSNTVVEVVCCRARATNRWRVTVARGGGRYWRIDIMFTSFWAFVNAFLLLISVLVSLLLLLFLLICFLLLTTLKNNIPPVGSFFFYLFPSFAFFSSFLRPLLLLPSWKTPDACCICWRGRSRR